MARQKYKLTGFAKFFLVMVILAPIAFFAAVYINEGEDGLNDLFKDDSSNTRTLTKKDQSKTGSLSLDRENQMLKDSIRKLNLELNEVKTENRLLKQQ